MTRRALCLVIYNRGERASRTYSGGTPFPRFAVTGMSQLRRRACCACARQEHELLGDVRGTGLMVGVEIVDGAATRRHAPATAHWLRETMLKHRVLLATEGPCGNVIKVKPPMCFAAAEADHLVETLAQARPGTAERLP